MMVRSDLVTFPTGKKFGTGGGVNPTTVPTSVPTSAPTGDVTSVPGAGKNSTVQLEDVKNRNFSSVGDPHETTGNGLHFDNMGIGYYTALKSASGDFELVKRQEKVAGVGGAGATLNTEAAVKAGDDVVKFDAKAQKFYINDKETAIKDGETVKLAGGGSVSRKGNVFTTTTPHGDVVNFTNNGKWLDISGEIAKGRKEGEISGELGRFDNATDASKDLVKRDGSLAANTQDFMDQWKTTDDENLLTKPAADFLSPEAKEINALKAKNAELAKAEAAASDERRPLLADFAKNESIYKALKEMPENYLAPADKDFMKKFEDTKAKIDDLGKKIADLNAQQADNQKKIDALVKIAELKGQNVTLLGKEQAASDERRPLLGQQAEMKGKAEELLKIKAQDDTKLAPADFDFLKNWSSLLDKIAQLSKLISDLNKDQKDNEDQIKALDKIAHPDKAVAEFKAPAIADEKKAA